MEDIQIKTEETPDLISKDQIEKNGTGGDGSETSDEFVKVDQEDELQADEGAGITELEPEEQLMEPLVPVAAPEPEVEPVVEASPETEVIAAKVEEPEPVVAAAEPEEQKPDVVPSVVPPKVENGDCGGTTAASTAANKVFDLTSELKAGVTDLTKDLDNIVPQSMDEAGDNDAVEVVESKQAAPVMDLLYWKDIKKSAIIFSLLLLVLTSLNYYSSVLVVSYLAMSMIAITMTCRVYSFAVQTVNGTQLQNPFSSQLNDDVTISEAQAMDYVKYLLPKVNCVLSQTRDLIFVNKFVNTLKFGVSAWILSYIGEWFNGLSLVIVGVIAAFTAPPLYKKYETEINQQVGVVMKKLNQVVSQVKSKIPGQKPKVQ